MIPLDLWDSDYNLGMKIAVATFGRDQLLPTFAFHFL
jgi:hypothetical protein